MKILPRLLLTAAWLSLAGCTTAPEQPRVARPQRATVPSHAKRDPAVPPRAVPPPVIPPAPVIPAAPAVPVAPTLPFRTVMAVQACLDRVNFSSGATGGEMNDQTRSALRAWQAARGLPVSGEIDRRTLARCGDLDMEFVSHVVTAQEIAALTAFPSSWRGRAALKRHGFVTIRETVAELYHSTEAAIERLNPNVNWPNPPAGTTLTVPKASPAKHVDAARLVISLSRKTVQGFDEADKLVLHFPCSIARDVDKRPVGELKVINAASDPFYTFDPELFADDPEAQGIGRHLVIPAGPNNPVGVAWVGLNKPGYGIHGTAWPEDIGKTESHGCFRLANWNARKLVRMVKAGTPVRVEP
jgi:lipoprotein-anchoring transpeptidase ErfK/SrfK